MQQNMKALLEFMVFVLGCIQVATLKVLERANLEKKKKISNSHKHLATSE